MIVEFKWWLSNTVSQALKTISESVFAAIESAIHTVFKAARIGWTTECGLEIFWTDTNIKPQVDEALKRTFLQQYNNFLQTAGTVQNDALLQSFFSLAYVYSIDMRDDPILSDSYPFHIVRFWIPPVDAALELEIRQILVIILPARCSKHYQLLTWIDGLGFGRTPFGRRFGR